VSLDGLAAEPNNSVDFIPVSTVGDQSFGQRQLDFMDSVDTILLGRVTYEMFARYWPNVADGDDKRFAEKINATHKLVFSNTLKEAPWGEWNNATVVPGKATKAIRQLKQEPGGDMVLWGSLSLAQSLIHDNLVDDYQLIVCPLVLGGGTPLFHENGDIHKMKLLGTRSFDRGLVLLDYEPARTA
jgi:dihydrofolate reductase